MEPAPGDGCDIVYFLDPQTGSAPGREYLRTAPFQVRATMCASLVAVAAAYPAQCAGGGCWEPMGDSMTGWFVITVNTKDRAQHRLFCLLDEDATGCDKPRLVVVVGRTKVFGTGAFRESDYVDVRALGARYRSLDPRSIT